MRPSTEFLYLTQISVRTMWTSSSRRDQISVRRCLRAVSAETTLRTLERWRTTGASARSGPSAVSGTGRGGPIDVSTSVTMDVIRRAPSPGEPSAPPRPPDLGRRAVDDLVDEAVLLGLLGGEPPVPVRVRLDPLDRLAGVEGDPLGHHPLQVDDLLGLDGDVGGLALHGPERLVHEDPGSAAGRSACPAAPAHSRNWPIEAARPEADGPHVAARRTAWCRRWPGRR